MTRDDIKEAMTAAGLKNPRCLIVKPRSGPIIYELCAGPNDGRKKVSVPRNPSPQVVQWVINQLKD